jgi:glycine/D-amino acid oxidase-like deaminating enzyme
VTKVAAVLGAGVQGCCAALALRQLGFRVQLLDKSRALMSRASANQEGKIHLGFVYARDDSQRTARTMIEHALRFAPALESLVGGPIDWEPHLSTRFTCGIHRDSTLTLDEHLAHFAALQAIYDEVSGDGRLHYLGRRPARIWSADAPVRFAGSGLVHAVRTEETAVHPGWMREVIVGAVARDPEITPRLGHEVESVEPRGQGFLIHGTRADGTWKSTADVVVNCLWEGQHRIDRAVRPERPSDWITRVKYGFMLETPPALRDLPSLIITHGPFGDIVSYPGHGVLYVTWYPACLAYIGQTERLPEPWEAACDGQHAPGVPARILDESVARLAEYVPELRGLPVRQVMAGAIMGNGTTDISDRDSGLHRRHGIGVEGANGYFSVFTGKFTSGPANALDLRAQLA